MKYDKKFYQSFTEFAGDILSPVIIDQARPYIKGKALDVGTGSGAMIDLLRKLPDTTEVHGIDIAPTRPDIIEAGIEKIPFADCCFNTVICSEVLEHLDDNTLEKGILEMYRVLKPAGTLIITTPYKDDLKSNKATCPRCGQSFNRWGHIQSFDEDSIRALLYWTFEIIRITPLSLGFLNAHKNLRYFLPVFKAAGFFKNNENLFVIAKRV